MGSLLVRATFGERVEGRFVLQGRKRSSENGVQTTFWGGWKRCSLERPCTCVPHTHYKRIPSLRDWQVRCVPEGTHVVGCRLQLSNYCNNYRDFWCKSVINSFAEKLPRSSRLALSVSNRYPFDKSKESNNVYQFFT